MTLSKENYLLQLKFLKRNRERKLQNTIFYRINKSFKPEIQGIFITNTEYLLRNELKVISFIYTALHL